MKKKILFTIIFLMLSIGYSSEMKFSITKNISIQNTNLDNYYYFVEGDELVNTKNNTGLGVEINDPLSICIYLYSEKNNKNFKFPIEYIELQNNQNTIPQFINKDYWIPSYYYEQIKEKNRTSIVLREESYWKTFKNTTEDQTATWIDFFGIEKFYFSNFYFVCFGSYGFDDVGFLGYLDNITENQVFYNIQSMYCHFFNYDKKTRHPRPDFLNLYRSTKPIKMILVIDGDYMNMYIDEVSEKNLFQTLIRTSPEACDQIENWIKGKSNDLSKVVMPKHGNNTTTKTSSTTSQKPATNVAVNETLNTNCNLKLRSGEATSTQVLTVMSAGTKVKILELGKAETIDGIKSNWVKVEIISGKDRDGKILKSGTTGWCYGGYLQ